ncbi:MAG TPA: hypothetical protein VFE17_10545 [Candidatus Baltobacteraceae bacterium]|jgi:hypothetical protein|nr:hypothetical protein [Candidatus Baltobacteraceae bacterium]
MGRQDAGTTLNALMDRVVSQTFATGNLTSEAQLEGCFRRVITSTPRPDGTTQHEVFGIPIKILAEIAAVALEDAVAFTVQLRQRGNAASTQDAQKHKLALVHAGLVLSALLATDHRCMAPERLLGQLMKMYDGEGAAFFMTSDPALLVNQLVQTCVRRLKVSHQYFKAACPLLVTAAFSDVWRREGPLSAAQSLYYLFEPPPEVFQSSMEQIQPAPGGLNEFVREGFAELRAAADGTLDSGDAKRAGALWNGARGLCTFANNGRISITQVHEDLPFANDAEGYLNAAGASGEGKDLTTWMLLGHAICGAQTALATNEYGELAGALGCFERISRRCGDSAALDVAPRTRIEGALVRFGYQNAKTIVAALEKRCRTHMQERLSEAIHRIALTPIAQVAQGNMIGLRNAVQDLVSHNLFWKYAPDDRSRHGLEYEALERRGAWRKAFNGLPADAVHRLREMLTQLVEGRDPVSRPAFLREMHEAFNEHDRIQASRSREAERSFP